MEDNFPNDALRGIANPQITVSHRILKQIFKKTQTSLTSDEATSSKFEKL
jgi:hypothetical protein